MIFVVILLQLSGINWQTVIGNLVSNNLEFFKKKSSKQK